MIAFLMKNKKCLWVAGMGTGKTLTALAGMARVGARRGLVVCPKSAILSVWVANVDRHTTGLKVYPLTKGSSKDKQTLLDTTKDEQDVLYVVNYETARLLNYTKLDYAVLDESQKLGTHNSRQTLELTKALASVPHVVCLTATPFADRPIQVYGQVRILSPLLTKKGHPHSTLLGSYDKFFDNHISYYTLGRLKIPTGLKDGVKLGATLGNVIHRVTDANVKLPSVLRIDHECVLEGELLRIYQELLKDFIARIDEGVITAGNVLVHSLRLQQATSGILTLDGGVHKELPSPKDGVLQELLDHSDPVVIFTRFKPEVARIAKLLGKRSLQLTGDTNELARWQAGEAQVLIANINAGGAGIELHRASQVIYYSHTTSRTLFIQSTGRIVRPDSAFTNVRQHHIVVKDTVEEAILKLMETKGKLENELLREIKSSRMG